MSTKAKVLWGEGLFLRPQHFQQQDVYHEHRLRSFIQFVQPYAWGVVEFKCDSDGLKNNTLRLLKLSFAFPDGELIEAPQQDHLPPPIDLNDIPFSQQSIVYYIALPRLNPFGENVHTPEASAGHTPSSRYLQRDAETPDLFTQAVKSPLSLLVPSLRLISEFEPRDAFEAVPILRLQRVATGGFELDEHFIPPCVTVQSSAHLMLQLRRLMDALQAKVNALQGHHREPSRHVIEFRSGDVSTFWLLHTASSAFATLSHYMHHPNLPPERLFEQLLNLAGALLTFSKSHALIDLPKYEHMDLTRSFGDLFALIRTLLDTVISAKYFAIALSETKPAYHYGQLDSGKINTETALYIAVSADLPALTLAEIVPLRFKVGAPDDVDKLVLSAMPGVKLNHAPQVPAAIPVRPDTLYFSIERKGALYERMLQAQSISIYVPNGLANLTLELMAVSS